MIRLGASAALAFATALFVAMPAAANAADLNSGCCADLEERIAELEVTSAKKGNRKVSVTVYGQISKAMLVINDGSDTETKFIDNGVSGSRFGFVGDAKISNGLTAGFKLEVGVNDQPSVPLLEDQLTIRQANWWISGAAGKFTMGLAPMASDGSGQISVANTDVASRLLSVQPLSGVLLGLDLPFNDMRRNVVRYDSPAMGGFIASASYAKGDTPFGFGFTDSDAWDVALRYAGEFGGFRVAAGLGLSQQDQSIGLTPILLTGRDRVIQASASAMHMGSGLFLNVAGGDVTNETALGGSDFRVYHMQGGWQTKLNSLGATTVYGEYSQFRMDGLSPSPSFYGAGIVQAIDAAAMDLYATARVYQDLGGDDLTVGMVGARIRF